MEFTPLRPTPGQLRPTSSRMRSSSGPIEQSWAKFGRTSSRFGRTWSKLCKFGPASTTMAGTVRAKFGCAQRIQEPACGDPRPDTNAVPLTYRAQRKDRPRIGQIRARIDLIRTVFDQVRQTSQGSNRQSSCGSGSTKSGLAWHWARITRSVVESTKSGLGSPRFGSDRPKS